MTKTTLNENLPVENPRKGLVGLLPDVVFKEDGSIKQIKCTYENFRVVVEYLVGLPAYELITRQIILPDLPVLHDLPLQARQRRYEILCYDECVRLGMKIQPQRVVEWLYALAQENSYNAAALWFEMNARLIVGRPDDERDKTIKEVFSCFGLPTDGMEYQIFLKWLFQCYAMANNKAGAYGAEIVLVLQSENQGIGKTRGLSLIFKPFPGLYAAEMSIDPSDRDSVDRCTRYWVVELSELERMTLKETGKLKSFVTSPTDEYRAPYARGNEKHPRYTSFCGTVNKADFLREDGRRFFILPINDVDLDRLEQIDMTLMWSEVFTLYTDPSCFRLSKEERQWITGRSREHIQVTDEEQVLLDCLDWETHNFAAWEWHTTTEVAKELGLKSADKVGRVYKQILQRKYPHLVDDFVHKKKNGVYKNYFPPYTRDAMGRIEKYAVKIVG